MDHGTPPKPANAPRSVRAVRLADGSWTWVDACVARRYKHWKWRLARARGYVQVQRGGVRHRLHRLVAAPAPDQDVHHLDDEPRNNWRANLLACRRKQHALMRSKIRNTTSRFIGVSWDSRRKRWRARVEIEGHSISLGRFSTEEDAARARDRAIMLLRDPQFWRLNLPPE